MIDIREYGDLAASAATACAAGQAEIAVSPAAALNLYHMAQAWDQVTKLVGASFPAIGDMEEYSEHLRSLDADTAADIVDGLAVAIRNAMAVQRCRHTTKPTVVAEKPKSVPCEGPKPQVEFPVFSRATMARGHTLRKIRMQLGLTLADAAVFTRLSTHEVSEIENGNAVLVDEAAYLNDLRSSNP